MKKGWFADLTDNEGDAPGYPWQPFLQTDGGCFPLSVRFQTREECEAFISREIVGAGVLS